MKMGRLNFSFGLKYSPGFYKIAAAVAIIFLFVTYLRLSARRQDLGLESNSRRMVSGKYTLPIPIPHNCSSWLKGTFEENLEVIKKYPSGEADKYMYKITGNVTKPMNIRTSFPVIVTASDSGYYLASQGLIKSIREKLPNGETIKIIYYDLGLYKEQKDQLMKYCNCEVRDFNFDAFPTHLRMLKLYAWKPVIVKQVLTEYDWIWWCDSSVRFLGGDPAEALQYSKDNSVYFITYENRFPTSQLTNVRTFEYLGEDICKYRYLGQLEANFLLFYYDHVTHIVVDKWTACALNEACIAPPESKLFCNLEEKIDGQCHRYDQSVLSIILRRLFHEETSYPLKDSYKVHKYNNNSLYEVQRGQAVHYFPS